MADRYLHLFLGTSEDALLSMCYLIVKISLTFVYEVSILKPSPYPCAVLNDYKRIF